METYGITQRNKLYEPCKGYPYRLNSSELDYHL